MAAAVLAGAIISYNYTADQTMQRGMEFGIKLEAIQDEIKEIQNMFYSQKIRWEEGDLTKDQLLESYKQHTERFREVISMYDGLEPPELFQGSVALLKLSSETQLASDVEYIKWIRTGEQSYKVRSDVWFQESIEYELQGLVEFYSAKTGVKNYAGDEKFQPPPAELRDLATHAHEAMKQGCDERFKNESGGFDSNGSEVEWFNCINDAQKWKDEHIAGL